MLAHVPSATRTAASKMSGLDAERCFWVRKSLQLGIANPCQQHRGQFGSSWRSPSFADPAFTPRCTKARILTRANQEQRLMCRKPRMCICRMIARFVG
jgi:hypothetical protein